MHAHHHDVAGQPVGRTAPMTSVITPIVSSPRLSLARSLARSLALSTVGRSPADGTRRGNLRSWNLDKPGMSGRFGAWTQDYTQDSAQDTAPNMGGRLRRRIEVSPH